MKNVKNTLFLSSPLLLFITWFMPYGRINSHFLVDWLGCGCVEGFNANDFTRIFWFFIAFWAIASSITLSQTLPKGKLALKVCYVVGISLVSLQIAFILTRLMMWC